MIKNKIRLRKISSQARLVIRRDLNISTYRPDEYLLMKKYRTSIFWLRPLNHIVSGSDMTETFSCQIKKSSFFINMKPRESGGRQSASEHKILNAHKVSTGLSPPLPPPFTLLISHLLHLFGVRTFTAQSRHAVFKMALLSFFGHREARPKVL